MFNIILNLIVTFGGMFLVSYYFYSGTKWKNLSKKYKLLKHRLSSLSIIQAPAYINQIAFSKLKIGVSNEGLFLSHSFLMGLASSSLLIPWNEISYEKDINNNSRTENLVLNLGNPKIASLQLSLHTIEKIHENYGEPIFFERLRELS